MWSQGAYINGSWGEQSLDIHFADFKFYITHHFLKEDCKTENGKSEEGTAIFQYGWKLNAFSL